MNVLERAKVAYRIERIKQIYINIKKYTQVIIYSTMKCFISFSVCAVCKGVKHIRHIFVEYCVFVRLCGECVYINMHIYTFSWSAVIDLKQRK